MPSSGSRITKGEIHGAALLTRTTPRFNIFFQIHLVGVLVLGQLVLHEYGMAHQKKYQLQFHQLGLGIVSLHHLVSRLFHETWVVVF